MPSDLPADFGSTLREWRVDADLTQRQLAAMVDLDFTYLSKIETGLLAPPSEEKVRVLARALGRDAKDTEYLVDLARSSKIRAADIKEAVVKHPELGALLRRVQRKPLTPDELDTIRNMAGPGKPNDDGREG
jgi:transcriptional regulator with XRE-family HTH domain